MFVRVDQNYTDRWTRHILAIELGFLLFQGKIKKGLVSTEPGLSCEDIKYSGVYPNGNYWIRPAGSNESFQAYCDMSAVGGT